MHSGCVSRLVWRQKATQEQPSAIMPLQHSALTSRWSMAARRSKSAPHMHVLVCICSNVRQFSQLCPAQLSFRLIVL